MNFVKSGYEKGWNRCFFSQQLRDMNRTCVLLSALDGRFLEVKELHCTQELFCGLNFKQSELLLTTQFHMFLQRIYYFWLVSGYIFQKYKLTQLLAS